MGSALHSTPFAAGAVPLVNTSHLQGHFSATEDRTLRMSRFACSRHGGRIVGSVCSAYWAWFKADGERTAIKERLCFDCTSAELSELLRNSATYSSDACTCPACGIDSHQDLDPVYLNLYLPKSEARNFELTTCSACAARLRLRINEGGEPLPDRGGRDGGPQPSTPNPWEALVS